MSLGLHSYAYVCAATLFANMANCLFSKPFEQFTPSQQYPHLTLNLFEGGSEPFTHSGFSVKRKKICEGMADYWLLNLLVQKCKKKIYDAIQFKPSGFKVTIYILTSPYSPLCSLYVFLVTYKDNLFNNQELLKLAIISFILVALTFVSGVKFHGEIRCSSLLGVKG